MHGAWLNTAVPWSFASFTCAGRPALRVLRPENHCGPPRTTAELSHVQESGFPTTDGLWYTQLTRSLTCPPNRPLTGAGMQRGELLLPDPGHAGSLESELPVDCQQVPVFRRIPGVDDAGVRELLAEPLHVGHLDQQAQLVAAVFLQDQGIVLEYDVGPV